MDLIVQARYKTFYVTCFDCPCRDSLFYRIDIFDLLLQTEMQTMLGMGVPPSKIVYANPCKQASHIRLVNKERVQRFFHLTLLICCK